MERTSGFPRCGIDNARRALHIASMKWRNQLLALFCLVVFAAFGVFYFQHWVVQKPFGIILFVGEGLSPRARFIAASSSLDRSTSATTSNRL